MHKLLRYAQVITLCEKCITLCGNYYVMRKLLRYAASQMSMGIMSSEIG